MIYGMQKVERRGKNTTPFAPIIPAQTGYVTIA